ncbi:uncharacterized protein VK521_003937 [Ammospiza maritima maritima]
MRGSGGPRERDGPGLGGFGPAAAACPWGCTLGPAGWSGAPFCPRHRMSSLADLPVPSQPVIRYKEREVCLLWDDGPTVDYYPWILMMMMKMVITITMRTSSPQVCSSWTFRWRREPFLTATAASASPSCARSRPGPLPPPWTRGWTGCPRPSGPGPTAEEADKNAQELMEEEERAKRKAEKKKLKKKKQKDRKKREKLGQEQKNKENTDPSPPSGPAGTGPPSEGAEDEGGAQSPPRALGTPLCPQRSLAQRTQQWQSSEGLC